MSIATEPTIETVPGIAEPWIDRADELTDWWERMFHPRPDAWGGIRAMNNRANGKNFTQKGRLTRGIVKRHFIGAAVEDVIGLFPSGPDDLCWFVVVEADNHAEPDEALMTRNADRMIFLHDLAVSLGMSPLLFASDDRGGFHLWLIFDKPVPTRIGYHFGRWLADKFKVEEKEERPESFPKQESVGPESVPFGNWVRLVGRHHTTEFRARVWNGDNWVEGHDAIDCIVGTLASDSDCIPEEAIPPIEPPEPEMGPTGPTKATTGPVGDRLTDEEIIERCLPKISNSDEHYDRWLRIGAACASVSKNDRMRSAFLAWSQRSTKHKLSDFDKCWDGFKRKSGKRATVASIIYFARQAGYDVFAIAAEERRKVREAKKANAKKTAADPVPDLDDEKPAEKPKGPEFPAPIPLDSPRAPELPDGIFGYWLGDFIDAAADANEVPPELPLTFALAAVSTVVQGRFSVNVTPGYFEPLNIWPLCAMTSGNRKTEAMKKASAPLAEIEEKITAELMPVIEKAKSELKTVEARIAKLRADAAKAKTADFERLKTELAEMEATRPIVPTVPQLFSQDVTSEHLATMLADNSERMSLISDEAGLIDLMGGRYNNGIPNLDVYLQSHAGSFVRANRGSRPPVSLKYPALTVAMSPQPDVLTGITSHKGFRGRGLLARFAYMIPTSRLGYRLNKTTPIPESISKAYREGIFNLYEVAPNKDGDREIPHVLTLEPESRKLWQAFWAEIETMMRPDGRLCHLTDWGGKLPGLVARIAGLLHCVAFTSCIASVKAIRVEEMQRAITFGRYLIDHAEIAFGLMGANPALEAARDLWRVIEKARQPKITLRDAWQPLRSSYKTVSAIEPGFDVLIDHAILMEPHQGESEVPRRCGRPPSRLFIVNPMLTEGWKGAAL